MVLQCIHRSFARQMHNVSKNSPLPRLAVFDLDFTLWPFWIDTNVRGPFRRLGNGIIFDSDERHVKHFPDVPHILQKAKTLGVELAVASRTSQVDHASELIRLFDWHHLFSHIEIYPGRKIQHFQRFRERSGIDYKDMLFFDDEHRNITDVSSLGVVSVLAEKGVSHDLWEEGLRQFAQSRQSSSSS